MTAHRPCVGYIPKGYPRISETFVSNEILELERLGLHMRIDSLKRPVGAGRQPSALAVRAPLRYVPEKIVLSLPLLLPVHLALLLRRPRRYWKCLRWTVAHCVQARSTSTLRRFFQAGYLVGWMLRGSQVDHFHAHFCHGPATVAMFVKWLTGATFSFTAHAKDLYLTERGILREKMREASFVVTCTAYNKRYLEEVGGDVTDVHLVYHGIDLSRFVPHADDHIVPLRSHAKAAGVPLVLSVGRLVEKKGFDVLLRACALLRDRGLRFRCAIYGDGERRAELENLARTLGLERIVELPGGVLQDDLVEIYRQADVFALPCQVLESGDRDGLPNVLVEAAAMQIPIVSTAVSGVPELIDHGVDGFLVEERSPEQLAAHIERLLLDPALRRQFGHASRSKVLERFDLRANTRRLFDLFHAAMGLQPVSPPESAALEGAPLAARQQTL